MHSLYLYFFITFASTNKNQLKQTGMKKTILASAIALIIAGSAIAQPVSDRAVIPIGVTLEQILRLHVIDGGNVEFVFNDLMDYTTGISNSPFYDTQIVIASSTDWQLHLGAEAATMEATDNPANSGIVLINNIGFVLAETGTYALGPLANTQMALPYLNSNTIANGLLVYTGGAGDLLLIPGALFNGGNVLQNAFTLNWECGTFVAGGTSSMNLTTILSQSYAPDRYTINAFLDIEAL